MDIIGQDGHIYKGRAGAKTSTTILTAVPKVLLSLYIYIIIMIPLLYFTLNS